MNENPGFLHLCELGNPQELDGSDADVFPAGQPPRWLHMCIRHKATATFLMDVAALDDLVVDAMTAEDTRSRVRILDGGIMVLLKAMHLTDKAAPEDMVSLRIWIDDNRIITTRELDVDPIHEMRDRIRKGAGPRTPGAFLADIMDLHFDIVEPTVEALEDQVGLAEQHVTSSEMDRVCNGLTGMQQRAAGFLRHLRPQRIVLEDLLKSETGLLSPRDRDRIGENLDQLLRLLETLQDVRERLVILNEQINRLRDIQLNRTSYIFTVAATIFLPLGFLTGMFGVNLKGIPIEGHPAGFAILAVFCVVLVLGLVGFFRWRKWL
ncbi:CorA family divalent cation transporter [Oceaniglobus trochenteri]|uniref:CorA family divalent cation transporter n=1 Tax=Oceaniglobus trochenteri TaxID=2763260 RepID=UPI001CFFC6C2|nr:CorA family divalent cation transporter [Oceaniglobus trochenteri]